MPPKQVYGKRSGAKTTTNYSKFLSPGKEEVSKRKQSETASERGVKKDPIVEIEQVLGALSLREEPPVVERKEQKNKSRGRPRKERKDGEAKTKTKEISSTIDASEEQISGTTAYKVETPAPVTPIRPRESKSKSKRRPASKPKTASLPTPEPTPEPDDVFYSYASTLLHQSYGRKILPFEQWSAELEPHFTITKIAEASFSEVYRLTAKSAALGSTNESVLKIVALKVPSEFPLPSQCHTRTVRDPENQANRERQDREEHNMWKSDVADVLSEVKLLQNLNDIPGFTNFRELTVLQGRPSTTFANAWKSWNKSRPKGRKSEFPDPSKKISYEDTQLWAVIEMQDAGTDCEKVMEAGGISTVWEVWDVFWGVCLGVAKAEEHCRFEHRDMHLENICIRSRRSKGNMTAPIIKGPLKRKLGFSGLETTVIDYTLSRADIVQSSRCASSRRTSDSSACSSDSSSTSSSLHYSTPEIAYLDLNKDLGIFAGDASEEYQYEIYRYMRGAAYYGNPLQSPPALPPSTPNKSPQKPAAVSRLVDEETEPMTPRRSPRKHHSNRYCDPPSDVWVQFHPKTNLVWAHFVLHRLMQHLETSGFDPAQISDEDLMWNLDAKAEDVQRVRKKAGKLHKVLEKVSQKLQPKMLGREGSLGSVKELVVLAMECRWLAVEDVAGWGVD
ncbi:hypothetical protein BS50DRAFT_579537 [Corynespora cassiicola Philippines]|uniref:non-specific serine/threonine protein kinase n=1 Tax=Corynespora cassiicola Philippines TaxID=1448308 RepID=A0A2T2N3L0_CORCC|nr:hypothetical protein BS50DRAFT_579537 [Corynespora cassiicola Philippines]